MTLENDALLDGMLEFQYRFEDMRMDQDYVTTDSAIEAIKLAIETYKALLDAEIKGL